MFKVGDAGQRAGMGQGRARGVTRGRRVRRSCDTSTRGTTSVAATTCEEGVHAAGVGTGTGFRDGGRLGWPCFSTKRRRRFFIIAFLI